MQVIEVQRSLALGVVVARWLTREVEPPLRAVLGRTGSGGLSWFAFAVQTLALAAYNHQGALRDARSAVAAMDELLPDLAGRWEHADYLMKGLIHQAVHHTDCFDHDRAARSMRLVTNYYGELADLFHAALPEVFPERVRSELHGRALGTWLQSEIYASAVDPSRLDMARRLSDRAIDEFPADSDKERQYQYRCQLETVAGNWEEARRYLARSLRREGHDHRSLADAIAALAEGDRFVQGFALLHWLRLGTTACLARSSEAEDFLRAIDDSTALS